MFSTTLHLQETSNIPHVPLALSKTFLQEHFEYGLPVGKCPLSLGSSSFVEVFVLLLYPLILLWKDLLSDQAFVK